MLRRLYIKILSCVRDLHKIFLRRDGTQNHVIGACFLTCCAYGMIVLVARRCQLNPPPPPTPPPDPRPHPPPPAPTPAESHGQSHPPEAPQNWICTARSILGISHILSGGHVGVDLGFPIALSSRDQQVLSAGVFTASNRSVPVLESPPLPVPVCSSKRTGLPSTKGRRRPNAPGTCDTDHPLEIYYLHFEFQLLGVKSPLISPGDYAAL